MLLGDLIARAAEHDPEQHAVWHQGQWTTYAELEQMSNGLARCLRDNGIAAGDRVALLLDNSPAYLIAFFAVLKLGGVVVPLNTASRAAELSFFLGHSETRAVIAGGRFSRHLQPALKDAPKVELLVVDRPGPRPVDAASCRQIALADATGAGDLPSGLAPCCEDSLAAIVYTSGSTGRPKGAMLTHRNLVSNTRSIIRYLELTANDSVLAILPFYYIYGQSLFLTHFMVGGSVVIDTRFLYPNMVLQTMAELGVTGFSGVPSTFSILLDRSSLAQFEFPSLRYVTQAGGAMAPALQKRAAEAFAPARLFIMYGATEASPRLSYLPPEMFRSKCGSIGKAVPDVELLVLGEDGQRLPAGVTGEVVARGPNIFRGYWKEPEETARVLKDGAYWTGDLGRMDDDGYFFIVGRAKDVIKVKGYRVSAQEVEAALLEQQGVVEAAAIAMQDPLLGEAIKAFVVTGEGGGPSAADILRHAKAHLPSYKQPKEVVLVNALPKNEAGKVMKSRLSAIPSEEQNEGCVG